ncbi:MAG: NAD(P)/FAD-dependent oxidoreductase [Bdellovibrionota bacterium]
MKKPNNIPLPNLSTAQKTGFSLLLLSGVTIFILTWYHVIATVYWKNPVEAQDLFLGVGIGYLAWTDTESFYRLLVFHGAGVLLLLGSSLWLFRKTSLRRKAKALIVIVASLLAALDITAWLYAPQCSSSNMYVGAMGGMAALPLLFLALTPFYQMWIYRRWSSPTGKPKRVVVIGGGFAGLYAAMGLNKRLGYHRELEITVLDRKNYFLFPPLLPSAAAGTIETRQVSYPFRRIFETTNIMFRKVDVTKIDPSARTISGVIEINEEASGQVIAREAMFEYDYLVLAPGSVTQIFNTPGAAQHAFFMRELNDAVVMRNHVIDCFERAAAVDDEAIQKELLRFVVVGAGPTGIETATEIYDLIHEVLLRRYPEVDHHVPEVCIIQSGEKILPGWHEQVVNTAEKQLNKLMIKLLLKARVTNVGPTSVTLGDGRTIAARTVIWCAGVKPSELLTRTNLPLDRSGRVTIADTLLASGYDNVFVLGDAAYLVDSKSGKPLPPLGQVAFQQGSHTAKNLVRVLSGESPKPFRYFDFGSLVSVGEHFAAVNLMGVRISGFIGWFIWRTLYLTKLVGFSNRIRVMIDWSLDLLIERSISQIRDSDVHRLVVAHDHRPASSPADEAPRHETAQPQGTA